MTDYTDLPARLRASAAEYQRDERSSDTHMLEAADAIESLSAKVAQLQATVEMQREALSEIAMPEDHSKCTHDRDAEIASIALSAPTDGWPKWLVNAISELIWMQQWRASASARKAIDALPASLRTDSSATTAAEHKP